MMRGNEHQQRILTIDQGNSSAKSTLWEGDVPLRSLKSKRLVLEDVLPLLEEYGEIDGCAYCSVCHTDARFLESLRLLVDGELMVLTSSVDLPFKVSYGSRRTLGCDRVAAVAGAGALFPGEALLVVDSGTALTIDVTDPEGNFMGGNISPGVHMRFRSLHSFTDQLPLVDDSGALPPFGSDTESAIRCGVIRGMANEISGAYSLARELYGCSRVVFAGNPDRPVFRILAEEGLPMAADASLVGRGLRQIFLHNQRVAGI